MRGKARGREDDGREDDCSRLTQGRVDPAAKAAIVLQVLNLPMRMVLEQESFHLLSARTSARPV